MSVNWRRRRWCQSTSGNWATTRHFWVMWVGRVIIYVSACNLLLFGHVISMTIEIIIARQLLSLTNSLTLTLSIDLLHQEDRYLVDILFIIIIINCIRYCWLLLMMINQHNYTHNHLFNPNTGTDLLIILLGIPRGKHFTRITPWSALGYL